MLTKLVNYILLNLLKIKILLTAYATNFSCVCLFYSMKIVLFLTLSILFSSKTIAGNSQPDNIQVDSAINKTIRYLETQQHNFDVPIYSLIKYFETKYTLDIKLNDSVFIYSLNDDNYKEWYLYKNFFDTSFTIQEDCIQDNITQNILLRSFYWKKIKLPKNYLEQVYVISKDGNYDLLHMYWVLMNVEDFYTVSPQKVYYDSLLNNLFSKIYNAYFLKQFDEITDESIEASAFISLGKQKHKINYDFIETLLAKQYKNGFWCFLNSDCDQYELSYTKEYIYHNTIVSLFMLLQWRENQKL